ncbi:DUF2809 domain-containing protein [Cellulomonas sp. WB94]|uniref:DUF2809 domain-containing protein n=1 Tax=Cellulomonas sp. WB94 TaxID=2173174 RepID=UPI000D582F14|nr:DUF2809 domain-containing protein [Cellulomonas sp. WB94]PVU82842.1 DUF2809 domain-containing protein [Cellulomonas sp. WB94]
MLPCAGSARRRRRSRLALAAVAVIAAGLATRAFGSAAGLDVIAKPAGDACYAVLVAVLVALVRPTARTWVVAAVAWAVCAVIELAQLTGVPAHLTEAWWPARLVLGTTFHAPDLIWYAVGVALAASADVWIGRRELSRVSGAPSPRRLRSRS